MSKPLILITNDDGYDAPGIRHLIDFVKDFGELLIVAPEHPQSGMGHAVTIATPLRLRKICEDEAYTEYACNGTPADTVKLALDKVCRKRPDIILSGINHGTNASVNVIYSGTMGAAIEGALAGIPSIGFSLDDFSRYADFFPSKKFVQKIVSTILEKKIKNGICLNVNIPLATEKELKGIKICRQSKANWIEEYEERLDPNGRKYYWLTGKFNIDDKGADTDIFALKDKYISVVPVTLDFTSYNHKEELQKLSFDV